MEDQSARGPLLARVACQVRRTPDAPAVVHGPDRLTYRDLDVRTNQLAHHLRSLGVGPESVVAVALPRSAEVVVALLAVLKAGGAYLPVDVAYPADRIEFMLRDADPALVLTTSGVRLPRVARRVDLDDQVLDALPTDAPDVRVSTVNTAYLVYTSGSTGTPKAVAVERRSLDDHLYSTCAAHPALAGETLWHSSVSFSMSVTSLFAPLTVGGCVKVGDLSDQDTACEFLKATPSHVPLLELAPAGTLPVS
ncbi:hypothetical protein GCM10029964_078270 [Kibdelosporangium lantanae]